MLFAFCADNLFANTQYPYNTVSADEEPVGYEAYRIGCARRHPAWRWQAQTANAAHRIRLNCQALVGGVLAPVLRAANFLAIDRANNLLGKEVILNGSDDGFATTGRNIFDIVLPTVPGGVPSGPLGCLTDEGAWIKTFPVDAHNDWELRIPAMGAGLVPKISGVTFGFAWIQTLNWITSVEDESPSVGMVEQQSDAGFVGSTKGYSRREGSVGLFFPPDTTELDIMTYQVLGLYPRKERAWLFTHYDDAPWRALYVRCPPGKVAWTQQSSEPLVSRLTLPFQESEPRP